MRDCLLGVDGEVYFFSRNVSNMEHHFLRSENGDSHKVTIFVSTSGFVLNPQCNDFETFPICRIL